MSIKDKANDEARMKEDSKKHTKIRSLLVDVGSESSIHGISRIVSDRPIFLRLLWLIAFFVALSFGLYQVYTIIHLFLKYSVKTNVEVRYSPIAFPAITICNMNIIKKSESGNLGNQNLQRILNGSSSYTTTLPTLLQTSSTTTPPGTDQPTTTTTQSAILGLPNIIPNIIPNEVTIPDLNLNLSTLLDDNILSDFYGSSDLLQPEAGKLQDDYIAYQNFKDEYQKLKRHIKVHAGHQIENMLLECTYAGYKCDRPSKNIVTPDYGNCYTLQSRRYISGTSGPVGGMTLTINLENHEAIETMTEGFGLRLALHEVGSFPLPLERGMTISGGFETSLALKLTTIKRKGPPYGDCEDPVEYFKNHLVRYTTQGCIQTCWETHAAAHCGCMAGYLSSEIHFYTDHRLNVTEDPNSTVTGCYTTEEKDCVAKLRPGFLMSVSKYCTCPPPCVENVYTTSYSGAIWPHDTKLEELKNTSCATYENSTACRLHMITNSTPSSNFLKLHIYFEELNYEQIVEEPMYDITQVIADIGGSLGLCIGVSLLCVFEAVEAIVGVLLVIKRKIQGHTRVKAQFD
ncbi:acid-sensing ion channel, other [Mytilus galloprovincialis]|uniref:Acid-sensing ion channel, other n=1 Tax=Mytilus galloprovincialis TaxID=29158 RepID=A0A8B6DMJ0_MYTGA|nr:acid-sensing ion channel, other [Mytilus galloprovincialis]